MLTLANTVDILAPGFQLTDRDLTLLEGLFEMRLLTLEHATLLYFEGRKEAAKKRIQKLKAAGLVGERERRAYEPGILFLTRKAFETLGEAGRLTSYPTLPWSALEERARVSKSTLEHELAILDVKASFTTALRKVPGFELHFTTWPLLFQFMSRPGEHEPEMLLKPDGYIRIHERAPDQGIAEQPSVYYFELDRSTETQDTLARKASCYRHHYRSGNFASLHGYSSPEERPFIVLVVVRNAERRNNAAERLLQLHPPILQQLWLTTYDEVIADPLGPIWVRPVDYRAVTEETPFDPELRRSLRTYARQPEREEMVEKAIQKHRLLEA